MMPTGKSTTAEKPAVSFPMTAAVKPKPGTRITIRGYERRYVAVVRHGTFIAVHGPRVWDADFTERHGVALTPDEALQQFPYLVCAGLAYEIAEGVA